MIKYSGIYESNTPPPDTKALWVDGGKLKVYKNNNWESVDDPNSKLTIDTAVKQGSTNPVSSSAVYSALTNKADFSTVEVNTGNIKVLTERVDEIQGTANVAQALSKENRQLLTTVQSTAYSANAIALDNEKNINTLSSKVADIKNVSDGNKQDIGSLVNDTVKPLESKVSNLLELNVVYPNNIRTLTTSSTVDEVKKAFIPRIGGSASVVNTPHVGYLIKGITYEGSSGDAPDSTIISVDIIKTDDKTYHKFIYIDNNTEIISITVDLVNYKLIDRSTLANIESNSKVGTLRDLYIQAGAKYNEDTGYYELNGLTDITEEEMREIYLRTNNWWNALPDMRGWYDGGKCRTNIPCPSYLRLSYTLPWNLAQSFNGDTKLEVINFNPRTEVASFQNRTLSGIDYFLQGNRSTKKVIGKLVVSSCPAISIGGYALEDISLFGINKNVNLYQATALSKESLLYMINNSTATSAITIFLLQVLYDKYKADTDVLAALEEHPFVSLALKTN